MANIMITQKCNLACPYCFANEVLNSNSEEITLDNFNRAIDFILSCGNNERIGLIGGEPTLHTNFKKILRLLINDKRIKSVLLFTNGILLNNYFNELSHPKYRLLINCNSENDTGKQNYEKLISNLETLFNERYMKDRVDLGINIYKQKLEYSYIIELLKKFDLKKIRVSISVPNISSKRDVNAINYFREMKPIVKSFFKELSKNEIIPYFDCNYLPSCILDEVDDELLKNCHDKFSKGTESPMEKICSPVIDILPNLHAVRCFGLSAYSEVDITKYNNIHDLRNYFFRMFDVHSFNTISSPECGDCYKRKVMLCSGGCLAYKISEISKIQKYSEKFLEERSTEECFHD